MLVRILLAKAGLMAFHIAAWLIVLQHHVISIHILRSICTFSSGLLFWQQKYVNILKPKTYFMYHQLLHTENLCSAHNAFMCFAWVSEQIGIISLYSINLSSFITEAESVYCAVRIGSLNQLQFRPWKGKTNPAAGVSNYVRVHLLGAFAQSRKRPLTHWGRGF